MGADVESPKLGTLPLPVRIRHGQVRTYSVCSADPLRVNPGPVSPPGPVDGNGLGVDLSGFARENAARQVVLNRVILAAVQIGFGEQARLLGIQQYLSMWAWTDAFTAPVEHQIMGPRWTFSDSRTTWHLSWAPGQPLKRIQDAGALGLPGYGGLGPWGTFYDLRFPWREPVMDLDIPVTGPGTLVAWLEFTQSDPATRPQRSPGTVGAFPPGSDDEFVMSYGVGGGDGQGAVYNRAAMALTVERGMSTDPGGV